MARKLARGERRIRRRRLIVRATAAGLVLVAVGVTALVLVERGGGVTHYSLTGKKVPTPAGEFSITSSPTSYQVVYRLDSYDGQGKVTTTTQDFTIRRPFDAKIVIKTGAPPGTATTASYVGTLGLFQQASGDGAPTASRGAPQASLGDFRLDASLGDLVAQGLFVARERRELLGRQCQVYRTGQPVEAGSVAGPAEDSYADVCIDADGVVLEEMSVLANSLSERRIATKVDLTIKPADSEFAITATPPTLAEGGQELNAISSVSTPTPGYWVLDAPPSGYELQGRYVMRAPAAPDTSASTTTTTVAGQAPAVTESFADVYVNGDKVIIVEQGPTAAEQNTAASSGAEVDAGALGTAHVAAGVGGSTLVATPQATVPWFVHVTGTVPLAEVEKVASSLHI